MLARGCVPKIKSFRVESTKHDKNTRPMKGNEKFHTLSTFEKPIDFKVKMKHLTRFQTTYI